MIYYAIAATDKKKERKKTQRIEDELMDDQLLNSLLLISLHGAQQLANPWQQATEEQRK
jgi:hypothetical protein